jgi:hypothetical protein
MKHFLLFFVTLFFLLETSTAQDSTHKTIPNASIVTPKSPYVIKYEQEFFAKKSKTLKTTAWVFLGVGTVFAVTGWQVYENNRDFNDPISGSVTMVGSGFLTVLGTAMVLTSIPLFIVSGHYKKKSLNLSASLKLEPCQGLSQMGISLKHYPAVGLRIRL